MTNNNIGECRISPVDTPILQNNQPPTQSTAPSLPAPQSQQLSPTIFIQQSSSTTINFFRSDVPKISEPIKDSYAAMFYIRQENLKTYSPHVAEVNPQDEQNKTNLLILEQALASFKNINKRINSQYSRQHNITSKFLNGFEQVSFTKDCPDPAQQVSQTNPQTQKAKLGNLKFNKANLALLQIRCISARKNSIPSFREIEHDFTPLTPLGMPEPEPKLSNKIESGLKYLRNNTQEAQKIYNQIQTAYSELSQHAPELLCNVEINRSKLSQQLKEIQKKEEQVNIAHTNHTGLINRLKPVKNVQSVLTNDDICKGFIQRLEKSLKCAYKSLIPPPQIAIRMTIKSYIKQFEELCQGMEGIEKTIAKDIDCAGDVPEELLDAQEETGKLIPQIINQAIRQLQQQLLKQAENKLYNSPKLTVARALKNTNKACNELQQLNHNKDSQQDIAINQQLQRYFKSTEKEEFCIKHIISNLLKTLNPELKCQDFEIVGINNKQTGNSAMNILTDNVYMDEGQMNCISTLALNQLIYENSFAKREKSLSPINQAFGFIPSFDSINAQRDLEELITNGENENQFPPANIQIKLTGSDCIKTVKLPARYISRLAYFYNKQYNKPGLDPELLDKLAQVHKNTNNIFIENNI